MGFKFRTMGELIRLHKSGAVKIDYKKAVKPVERYANWKYKSGWYATSEEIFVNNNHLGCLFLVGNDGDDVAPGSSARLFISFMQYDTTQSKYVYSFAGVESEVLVYLYPKPDGDVYNSACLDFTDNINRRENISETTDHDELRDITIESPKRLRLVYDGGDKMYKLLKRHEEHP